MPDDDAPAGLARWRLAQGSHDWPAADGATCVTEAAIVAAGLPYRAVIGTSDCPPCFSRPISAFLMGLNEQMGDAQRQRLMRFVPRLAGSADAPEVERRRHEHIVVETLRRVVSSALEAAAALEAGTPHRERFGVAEVLRASAEAYRGASQMVQAASLSYDALRHLRAALASVSSLAARQAVLASREARNGYEIAGAATAARQAWAAWSVLKTDHAARAMAQIWDETIAIAEGALAIGRQAEPIATEVMIARMRQARLPRR
jgi:hypothetical protein